MIKPVDDKIREMLVDWGTNHSFTILPKEFLPEGLIVYIDDKPVIAGYMYVTTENAMGFIAYVIANPEMDKNIRDEAFPELIRGFNEKCKGLGVKFLFTTTNNGSLTNRFRNEGFVECDTDVVHLLKPVK
jgi:hypothetical protein